MTRLYPTLRAALAPPAPVVAPLLPVTGVTDAGGATDAAPAAVVPVEATPAQGTPRRRATGAPAPGRPEEARREARRARRLARYEEVAHLHTLGWSVSAIARQVALDRDTVRKWLRQGQFPEHQPRARRGSELDAHEDYLRQRWQAGCHNARRLWAEVQERGYRGGYTQVSERVRRLRQEAGSTAPRGQDPQRRAAALPGVRQLKWLLLRPTADLSDEEYALVQRLCQHNQEITVAYGVVIDFQALVRQRQAGELASWVSVARASGVSELVSFAQGVLRDWAAVFAGLELEWSNERAAYCTPSPRSSLPGRIHFRWRCPLAGQVSGRRNKQLLRSL